MLTIEGLTRPGLAPFDFELAAGEAVAVLGASGSGKSILLRAIADLDANDGEVALGGRARSEMTAPEWRRMVTYLAVDSGWWDDKVAPNFVDPAAAKSLFPALQLADAALDWDVARLSTGERQRLALARVLALEPQVMLLDEPTSSLDAEATEAVEAVLRDRLEAGASLLFVTHDAAQARRLARRCLRIDAGVITEGVA